MMFYEQWPSSGRCRLRFHQRSGHVDEETHMCVMAWLVNLFFGNVFVSLCFNCVDCQLVFRRRVCCQPVFLQCACQFCFGSVPCQVGFGKPYLSIQVVLQMFNSLGVSRWVLEGPM